MKEEHKQEAGSPAYQGTKVESVCDATSMTTLAIDEQTRAHTVTDIALLTNHARTPLSLSQQAPVPACPAAATKQRGESARHARAQAGL